MMVAGIILFFVGYIVLFALVDYELPENNDDDGTADG